MYARLIIGLIGILLFKSLQAQDTLDLDGSLGKVDLLNSGIRTFHEQSSLPGVILDSGSFMQLNTLISVQLVLRNSSGQHMSLVLYQPSADTMQATLHRKNGDTTLLTGLNITAAVSQLYFTRRFLEIMLSPGEVLPVTFSIKHIASSRPIPEWGLYLKSQFGWLIIHEYFTNFFLIEYNALGVGALLFSFLAVLFMSFWLRHASFVWYAIYLAGAIIYLLGKFFEPAVSQIILARQPLFQPQFSETTQFLFYAAYLGFTVTLLEIKRYKYMYRFYLFCIYIFFIYAIGIGLYLYFNNHIHLPAFFFKIVRTWVYLPVAICFIWIIVQVKSPVKNYYIIGSGAFITGTM